MSSFLKNPSETTSIDMDELQETLDLITTEKKNLIEEQLQQVKPLIEAKDRKIKELEEELEKYKQELYKCQKNNNKCFWSKL